VITHSVLRHKHENDVIVARQLLNHSHININHIANIADIEDIADIAEEENTVASYTLKRDWFFMHALLLHGWL
jgi:hypothetical protein